MATTPRVAPANKDRKGHFLADKDKFCTFCAVRSGSFCGMVPNEDMTQLSGQSRSLTLVRRNTLFHQGDESRAIYVVTSGTLRLYQMLMDGRRQVIGFAIAGDLLGFPFANSNEYSADALDSVYLCQFQRTDFLHFIDQRNHILKALLLVTGDELRRAREQVTLLSQKNAERKMAQFLLNFRSLQTCGNATALLPVRIPQADIADFLGLTIETVNRTLAHFAREQVIRINDTGIELLDLPRLHVLEEG